MSFVNCLHDKKLWQWYQWRHCYFSGFLILHIQLDPSLYSRSNEPQWRRQDEANNKTLGLDHRLNDRFVPSRIVATRLVDYWLSTTSTERNWKLCVRTQRIDRSSFISLMSFIEFFVSLIIFAKRKTNNTDIRLALTVSLGRVRILVGYTVVCACHKRPALIIAVEYRNKALFE